MMHILNFVSVSDYGMHKASAYHFMSCALSHEEDKIDGQITSKLNGNQYKKDVLTCLKLVNTHKL